MVVAHLRPEDSNLKALKARIEETLARFNPINIKCLKYTGWSSSNIEEFIVVRIDKENKTVFNSDGIEEDWKDIYEYSPENLKIKENFENKNREGWNILKKSEEIGKTMKRCSFHDLNEEVKT